MFKALCSVTLSALLTFSLVAQTNPGSAQPGAAPSTLIGCVHKTGEVYTITDETSRVTAQLRGGSLKNGRHVQVSGTPAANASPAGGATEVLDVATVKGVGGSCQVPVGSYFVDPPGKANPATANSGSGHRALWIGIFVMAAVTAGGAIATASRQGAARGTTNNDVPAINH